MVSTTFSTGAAGTSAGLPFHAATAPFSLRVTTTNGTLSFSASIPAWKSSLPVQGGKLDMVGEQDVDLSGFDHRPEIEHVALDHEGGQGESHLATRALGRGDRPAHRRAGIFGSHR